MGISCGIFSVFNDFKDIEWEEAQNADEKLCYYRVHMLNGGIKIKQYKPSVAKLWEKRTAERCELIG